jgi:ATP/maltotriose-dependent transcriptional regulator MalT
VQSPPRAQLAKNSNQQQLEGIPAPEQVVALASQHRLARRELEVLALTCQAASRKIMAHRLKIAQATLNIICDRLHKKLHVKDRMELLRKVLTTAAETEKEV